MRGGKQPGAGRPIGSTKPNSRNNRLTQRYSNDEIALISKHAAECGYEGDLTGYIRDTMLLGVMACR